MEDKSVEPTIKRNLAGQPTFRCGPLCKLKQIGFHAVIGEPSDPLDPGAIDMNVACGASALAATIAVNAWNIVEQRGLARRQPRVNFDRNLASVVSNKSDLDHGIGTFLWRANQCA